MLSTTLWFYPIRSAVNSRRYSPSHIPARIRRQPEAPSISAQLIQSAHRSLFWDSVVSCYKTNRVNLKPYLLYGGRIILCLLFPRRFLQSDFPEKFIQRNSVIFAKHGDGIDGQRTLSRFSTTDIHSGIHRYPDLGQTTLVPQRFQSLRNVGEESDICSRNAHRYKIKTLLQFFRMPERFFSLFVQQVFRPAFPVARNVVGPAGADLGVRSS